MNFRDVSHTGLRGGFRIEKEALPPGRVRSVSFLWEFPAAPSGRGRTAWPEKSPRNFAVAAPEFETVPRGSIGTFNAVRGPFGVGHGGACPIADSGLHS